MVARWLGLLALTLICLVAAPELVAIALLWASQDGANVLPAWLQWLNTYDDVGPSQGLYEPQVAWVQAAFGWYAKTWYWLGIRNQMYGLFHWLAPVVDWETAAWRQTSQSRPDTAPYKAGTWTGSLEMGGRCYAEWTWVWSWSTTKCGKVRVGWKLQPLFDILNKAVGAPKAGTDDRVMFCFQVKPYLTKG